MATADDHSAAAVPRHDAVFNEDEDLLDDDDDQISDHDEDDSASSAPLALDGAPSTALVTVAVHGVPDLHHNQQQQDLFLPESRKPDESRKLFQRLWTDQDEIELLQGFLDYTTQRCGQYGSSQHHHDTTAFYDQIRSKFQLDFNKSQLVEKLRRLKKKYRNLVNRFSSGKDYIFKSPHDQLTFEISSKIWGNANGSAAYRSTGVEEDDDDLNNPAFISCQNPIPSRIDVNSKAPRPRKRNRAGPVKLEEKMPSHTNYCNVNNIQPPTVGITPIAAPVLGIGISGPISTVIEETIKSSLSPVLKELLGNSSVPSGLFCGHGSGTTSPLSLCFPGAVAGDKTSDDRWRKQQILELEVFSKRLELVQSQIRDQLQELRFMEN